jgi:hypothetical protein
MPRNFSIYLPKIRYKKDVGCPRLLKERAGQNTSAKKLDGLNCLVNQFERHIMTRLAEMAIIPLQPRSMSAESIPYVSVQFHRSKNLKQVKLKVIIDLNENNAHFPQLFLSGKKH